MFRLIFLQKAQEKLCTIRSRYLHTYHYHLLNMDSNQLTLGSRNYINFASDSPWSVSKYNVLDLVGKWSKDRNPECINCINFLENTSIPQQLWTKVCHWALENRGMLQRSLLDGSVRYFTASSTMKTPLTSNVLRKFDVLKWKWSSFEELTMVSGSLLPILASARVCIF